MLDLEHAGDVYIEGWSTDTNRVTARTPAPVRYLVDFEQRRLHDDDGALLTVPHGG